MDTKRMTLAAAALGLVAVGVFLITSNDPPDPTPGGTPGAAPAPSTVTKQQTPLEPTSTPEVTSMADGGASPRAVVEVQAPPNLEMAPSPFDSADSKELQYAVQLVIGPGTGPEQWLNAAKVFQRCVDQNPNNHLCRRGVYGAWERLDSDGGPATALTSGMEVQRLEPPPPAARKDGITSPIQQRRSP